MTVRTSCTSCSETKRLIVCTSEVQRCMMSPVLFSLCHTYGRLIMCENSSQRMRSTKVSAPLALQPRNRNLDRAASAPTRATASARYGRCRRRTSMPPAHSTSRMPNAGSFGSALPITLSTVKEMIFGLIMSSSDTRAANRRLKAKYRFAPCRKYRIKLVFVRYVCILRNNDPISYGYTAAAWFLTKILMPLYPYMNHMSSRVRLSRQCQAGHNDCPGRAYRIQ